ncbi:hypothetical protein WDZ92_15725 [Nostoc sp. NIES-2111]
MRWNDEERITESTWLLYRAAEVEVQRMFHTEQFAQVTSPAQIERRKASLTVYALESLDSQFKVFANLTRFRTTHERSLHRAPNALAKRA